MLVGRMGEKTCPTRHRRRVLARVENRVNRPDSALFLDLRQTNYREGSCKEI
jgi:hypothetical protein